MQTPDVSYNSLRMGLWTVAEMATGILVSCPPVMPKFFQRVNPRITNILSHSSEHMTRVAQRSGSRKCHKRWVALLPFIGSETTYSSRGSGSQTLRGDYNVHIQGKREYIALEGLDLAAARRHDEAEPPRMLVQGTSTMQEDLEAGIHAA